MWSDLERLPAGQRQRLNPDPQLGSAGNASTTLGAIDDALYITVDGNQDAAVDRNGAGSLHEDSIALLSGSGADGIDHPQQQVSALRYFSRCTGQQRTCNQDQGPHE